LCDKKKQNKKRHNVIFPILQDIFSMQTDC